MTICLQDRTGEAHIIGWTTSKGNHYTLCDRYFKKARWLQTYALDNSFSGVCKTCKHAYDTMYKDDLELFLSMAHGGLVEDLVDDLEHMEKGRLKIQYIYDKLQYRVWDKLTKYKNLLNRK